VGKFLNMHTTYKDKLTAFTSQLVTDHDYLIIGQGAQDGGHGMASTIDPSLKKKCIELPVFEESQTGIALGLGLAGFNVMSIYPRFDFFISGLSQFINHSDKLNEMSQGQFNPNIIFRVGVGAKEPLDAGPQHTNNYSEQIKAMLKFITVHELDRQSDLNATFDLMKQKGGMRLLIEHYEFYGDRICGN
jgi:pyruvate/2-oxoglutarate/acetoin dehydrogenase E1 component